MGTQCPSVVEWGAPSGCYAGCSKRADWDTVGTTSTFHIWERLVPTTHTLWLCVSRANCANRHRPSPGANLAEACHSSPYIVLQQRAQTVDLR